MPSDNHPNPGQPIPQTVHVALYEHRYGTDVRAFLDSEEAMHWRTEIAKEWWTDAFDDDLPPDDQIGDVYFERMLGRDEFFWTKACEIKRDPPDSTDPDSPVPSADGGGA